MDQAACSSAYYASLLTWVGCAVDTSEVAALFGDEMQFYADTRDGDLGGVGLAVFVARHLGRGKSGFHRIGMVGKFLASAGRSVQRVMQAHCQEASDLADQLGLGPAVSDPLRLGHSRRVAELAVQAGTTLGLPAPMSSCCAARRWCTTSA